ncbi:MAG: BlaI/MecI/CopY family transcriptional regulator [Planctomycetaceae bacterium]
MPIPEGNLTSAQYEIMDVVWRHGRTGATVAEIWEAVSETRSVARTTVLNLVDRLEKRNWLKRRQRKGTYHYTATVSRKKTSELLAGEFIDDFFGGSATDLVMSLLGSKQLSTDELNQLRKLLDSSENDQTRQTNNGENETS